MEITYKDETINATGDRMEDCTINYKNMVITGISWLDTLTNANLKVKVQAKMREIARNGELTVDQKESKFEELSKTLPENLLGSNVSFGRSDVDNILAGQFSKTLPSVDTLADSFIDGIITSKKEFTEVKKFVTMERKARKKTERK